MLSIAEKFDPNAETPAIETLPQDWVHHNIHVVGALWRLAWAIRAVHGDKAIQCHVDATFIDGELQSTDSKEREYARKLPAGIGTLFFAGKLAQASRSGSIQISGNGVAGHDIRWVTPLGHVALIERKDRSYEAGLGDTHAHRVRKVIREADTAGRKIPSREGAARILVVGFQDLVRPEEVNVLGAQYFAAMAEEFGREQSNDLPDCVIVEHFGIEAKTGGERTNFWCPMLLRNREELEPVWSLRWKAIDPDPPPDWSLMVIGARP
jgi:hypothetical protein